MDAGSSTVIKYSPTGKKLMTIAVGEQPAGKGLFSGTTDIAFGPAGHLELTGLHGVDLSAAGEPVIVEGNRLLWLQPRA